ncbi:MAG: aspartate dehydrogenase [Lachnospiraceae bacterium]|nr:aspartate dehydrogenase [Lachnospiraceae bacterium]
MLFKNKKNFKTYDKETQIPVLRCSICTGERVAGFKDKTTGKFNDITLIRTDADLKQFMKEYGVEKITKEY